MLREKLREYLKVSGALNELTQIVDTANDFMLKQLHGTHSAAEIDEIKKLNEKYMILMQNRLDEFQEKFIDLYEEFYTEEDVDALIAYYNSPIAKKQRDVSNKLFSRALEISSDFNNELLKQLAGATLNRQLN